MKVYFFLALTFVLLVTANAQVSNSKEWSKEIALYKSKKYIADSIIGSSKNPVKFQIDALAATSSGELTSLIYTCEDRNVIGMLFNFYGTYWNNNGVVYQGFDFRNFEKIKATELLNLVEKNINDYKKYLSDDIDNNNVYFEFEDLKFIISQGVYQPHIRVFWKNFEVDWDIVAFGRTKRRLEKRLK